MADRAEVPAAECSHSWRTCPVHSTGTDEMPPFWKVIRCVSGDYETKEGEPMDDDIAKDLTRRVVRRLGG
jgi:hypothetical protein